MMRYRLTMGVSTTVHVFPEIVRRKNARCRAARSEVDVVPFPDKATELLAAKRPSFGNAAGIFSRAISTQCSPSVFASATNFPFTGSLSAVQARLDFHKSARPGKTPFCRPGIAASSALPRP